MLKTKEANTDAKWPLACTEKFALGDFKRALNILGFLVVISDYYFLDAPSGAVVSIVLIVLE